MYTTEKFTFSIWETPSFAVQIGVCLAGAF